MKVHILFESNDTTNGRIVGVYANYDEAMMQWGHLVDKVAKHIDDTRPVAACTFDSSLRSYMPDDTEEHSNIHVALFLDVDVTQ